MREAGATWQSPIRGAIHRRWCWATFSRREGYWLFWTTEKRGTSRCWKWVPLDQGQAKGRWRAVLVAPDRVTGSHSEGELLASGPRWWCELQMMRSRLMNPFFDGDEVVERNPGFRPWWKNEDRRRRVAVGFLCGTAALLTVGPFLISFIRSKGVPHP